MDEIRELKEASEKELEEVLEVSRANSQAIRDALEAEAASEKQALIEGRYPDCSMNDQGCRFFSANVLLQAIKIFLRTSSLI